MTSEQPSLQQVYTRELQPLLAALEEERLWLRNRVLWSGMVITPVVLFAGFFLGWLGWILGAIAAIVFIDRYNRAPWQRYRKQFKQRVVQRLVKLYNPTFNYAAENGISQATFDQSQIFGRKSDRYHYEDLVSGKIGNTRFRFSEIRAEYQVKKNDEYELLFGGLFFVADFNKFFKGTTVMMPDLTGRMGRVGEVLEGVGQVGRINIGKPAPVKGRPPEKVRLEDPTFEKFFEVYSTDQIEARYILSTSLMERLVQYCQTGRDPETGAPRSSMIWLSFTNSCVHLAIPTFKNYFEPPSIFKNSATLTLKEMQDYMADLKLAEDLVEMLNLNVRIWGKR